MPFEEKETGMQSDRLTAKLSEDESCFTLRLLRAEDDLYSSFSKPAFLQWRISLCFRTNPYLSLALILILSLSWRHFKLSVCLREWAQESGLYLDGPEIP